MPLCLVTGILAWFWDRQDLSFHYSTSSLAGFLLFMLTTYIITETANTFTLLRIRSRMIASVWLAVIAIIPVLHDFSAGWVGAATMAGSYYTMFLSYQERDPVVDIFHTFVLLGCTILSVPELCILIPIYYWYMLVMLRCMSWRGLWAGVIGLLFPFSLVAGWCIVTDDYRFLLEQAEFLSNIHLFNSADYTCTVTVESLTCAFLGLLSFVGVIHFLRTYYNDKIRTRMFLYIYVTQTAVCWLVAAALPCRFEILLPLIVLNASTPIAHYFALTGSRLSNAFFCFTLLASVALLLHTFGLWTL